MKAKNESKIVFMLAAGLAIATLTTGCLASQGESSTNFARSPSSDENPAVASSPSPTPQPSATPKPTPTPVDQAEAPLLWEAKRPEGKLWTQHTFNMIDRYGSAMLLGADDVESFCPTYYSLSSRQKINFWGVLISAITKYESNFNPLSRMKESFGPDPITGTAVYSEGLLQLSYQDSLNHPYCNEFDYETDKAFAVTDSRRTILDPYKNLSCGIRILNRQIERRGLIATSAGVYWAVIRPDGAYNKLKEIRALTNAVSFCKR